MKNMNTAEFHNFMIENDGFSFTNEVDDYLEHYVFEDLNSLEGTVELHIEDPGVMISREKYLAFDYKDAMAFFKELSSDDLENTANIGNTKLENLRVLLEKIIKQ